MNDINKNKYGMIILFAGKTIRGELQQLQLYISTLIQGHYCATHIAFTNLKKRKEKRKEKLANNTTMLNPFKDYLGHRCTVPNVQMYPTPPGTRNDCNTRVVQSPIIPQCLQTENAF